MGFITEIKNVTAKPPEIMTGTVVREANGRCDVRLPNGQMIYRVPANSQYTRGVSVSLSASGIIGAASPKMLSVTVSRGNGDRIAPVIQSNLISTTEMAEMRGNRYLDDPDQGGFWTTIVRNLKVPHKEGALTARFASVQCTPLFGYDPRIFRVNSYSWTWTPEAGTDANIEVLAWYVPTFD